jgi:7-cyano-7-deazaguanine reductase
MTSDLHTGPLGIDAEYTEGYDSNLLFPMPRHEGRSAVGLEAGKPWTGHDLWTGYEFSWLNAKGRPSVAVLTIVVDAESTHIVESKSMKLYLNGFAQTRFSSTGEVLQRLQVDLDRAFGSAVTLTLMGLDELAGTTASTKAQCLDELDVEITSYQRDPSLLVGESGGREAADVEELLVSHLFRSLCPVTAQPDWASIFIQYQGAPVDREGLLAYLISYREHQAFHETTVERIYEDIWQRCKPRALSVSGRFLRRGGLDINPFRTSSANSFDGKLVAHERMVRQ